MTAQMAGVLERARADLTRAQWKRDDVIREASAAGMSLRQIALHTGMSHAGVAKVLARSKGTQDA